MPDTQPDLTLLAGGRAYGGWTEINVRRGMDQCAGQFRLAVSERWPGQEAPQAVQAGERCEVRIGTETVVTGYVDECEINCDASDHSVELTGRDATADLVDCSAIRKTGQWRGLRIEQIAAELAAPFGVKVTTDVDTGKALTSFALQEGETVFDAIARAAKIRALLLVSDGQGGLVVTRAGVQRITTPLALGGNLLSCRARTDHRDRFSQYLIKGQAPGSDYFSGTAASQVTAKASDPGITRYRPLIITADSPDIAATLAQRALWEANNRAARSLRFSATVQGWQHAQGLWAPNRRVNVQAEALHLVGELLITNVEFYLGNEGTVTRLELTRPDAYQILPIKAQDVGQGFWSLPKPASPGAAAK